MNKKGFTLVELLAVIVILGIIALIATPIILGVIEDSKKSAADESTKIYLKAIEQQTVINELEEDITPISDGLYNLPLDEVIVSGTVPTTGWVLIEEGKVIDYSLVMDGYIITKGVETIKGNTPVEIVYEAYAAGDLVYFDPVTKNTCNADTYNGTNTCYKWRVIETEDNDSKTDITIQLDHNIINTVIWAPTDISTGPVTALEALNASTALWRRVANLNYTYDTMSTYTNYRQLECIDGYCLLNGVGVDGTAKARIITGEEITKITNTKVTDETAISKSWSIDSSVSNYYYFSRTNYITGTKTSGTGTTELSWLVENTYASTSSGATKNSYGATNYGYWTLSPISGHTSYAWHVYGGGCLNYGAVIGDEYNFGIRPVITIPKLYL